jgi:hypothetical protein
VSRVEPRETQVSPLGRLREQYHQLLLIDSHEEAGNLTARTAAYYRVHVLRGGSIFGFPLDGANAAQFVKRWRQTERALCLAANKQRLSARTERARYLRGPSVRKRGSARASRRRGVRTAGSRARAPGPKASDDDPPSVTDSPAPRPCEVCGEDFTPKRRSNARVCSNRCRQAGFRKRRRVAAAAARTTAPRRLSFDERQALRAEIDRRRRALRAEADRQEAQCLLAMFAESRAA